jgi:glycosylphosphatidylinositol transamidase
MSVCSLVSSPPGIAHKPVLSVLIRFDQADGVNGHLPNLDYVNSASHILKHSAIPPILHGDLSVAHLQRTALAGISKRFDTDGARLFMRSAKQLWRQLAAGASGAPSGPEGVYGRYRIDAITMFAIPAERPHGFHALGR